jgi:hypothetical protein
VSCSKPDRIVLLAADDVANAVNARQLQLARPSFLGWGEEGPETLARDTPRPWACSTPLPSEKVEAVVEARLNTALPGRTHLSLQHSGGASDHSLQPRKIWKAHSLQPRRVETFKLSLDHRFENTLMDVIVLCPDPSETALVLCVDEKRQIKALKRTQPVLPLRTRLRWIFPSAIPRTGR